MFLVGRERRVMRGRGRRLSRWAKIGVADISSDGRHNEWIN
jgi:hypothetical protein